MMWLEQAYNYISGFNSVSVLIRIVIAVLFGSLTGLDRTRKRRPAGFRTYSMVCLGSALTMIIGQYIVIVLGMNTDPVRIGAQVVSGVGFLGAGTILNKSNTQVRGLTTAAGLWASACLGLVIGTGYYLAAIAGLLSIIFIQTYMYKINEKLIRRASVINIYLELIQGKTLGSMIISLKSINVRVSDIEPVSGKDGNVSAYLLTLNVSKQCKLSHQEILKVINDSDGIVFCEQLN